MARCSPRPATLRQFSRPGSHGPPLFRLDSRRGSSLPHSHYSIRPHRQNRALRTKLEHRGTLHLRPAVGSDRRYHLDDEVRFRFVIMRHSVACYCPISGIRRCPRPGCRACRHRPYSPFPRIVQQNHSAHADPGLLRNRLAWSRCRRRLFQNSSLPFSNGKLHFRRERSRHGRNTGIQQERLET